MSRGRRVGVARLVDRAHFKRVRAVGEAEVFLWAAQLVQAPPSSRHSNVEPGSFELKVKVGSLPLLINGGALSIVVTGAAVSIVTSTWFEDVPSLSAASVAVAAKSWAPSDSGLPGVKLQLPAAVGGRSCRSA